MRLWASDALSEEELVEAGIADIDRALGVLGRIDEFVVGVDDGLGRALP